MPKIRLVISEPKTRKTVQVEKDELPSLIGLKIGDTFEGTVVGLGGFTLEITGGSDTDGFPMRPEVLGAVRKKILLASGPGYRPKKKGIRRRKYVRGNTLSESITQINVKVVEGEGDVGTILGIKPKEKAEKKPEEEKK